MHFDIGSIIAIIAALLFYLRLIIVQRQRAKQTGTQRSKTVKKSGGVQQPTAWVVIRNWYLVGPGILLIAVGALISAATVLPAVYRSVWWLPVTIGILLMALGIG